MATTKRYWATKAEKNEPFGQDDAERIGAALVAILENIEKRLPNPSPPVDRLSSYCPPELRY